MPIVERDGSVAVAAAGSLIALLAALALATPVRAAAQGTVAPDSIEEPARPADSYDEPLSVYNAHRLVRVIADGGHVVLGDGTIWEIFLPDRPRVDSWRRGDLLLVRPAGIAQGFYDYSLINGRTKREVAARLLGAATRGR